MEEEEEEAGERLFNQRNIRQFDKSKRPTSAPITSAPINKSNDEAVRRKSFSAADTKQSPLTEDQVSSVDTGDDSATEVVSDLKYDSSEEESSDDDSAREVVSVSESSDDESDISEEGQSDSEEEEEAGQQQPPPQPQQGEPVEIKFFEGDKPNEGYAIFRGVKTSQPGGVDYNYLEDKYSLANGFESHMYPRNAIPEYPYGAYYYVAFFHNRERNRDDISDIFSNISQNTFLFFRCIGAFPNLHFAKIAVDTLLNTPIPDVTEYLSIKPTPFFSNILNILKQSNIPEYTETEFLDSYFFRNESNFDLLYMLHKRSGLKLRFKTDHESSTEYDIHLTIGIGETTPKPSYIYFDRKRINSIKKNMANNRNRGGKHHATHIKITFSNIGQNNNIPTHEIQGGTTEYSDDDDDVDVDDDVDDDGVDGGDDDDF
jgi:hypothetical protein